MYISFAKPFYLLFLVILPVLYFMHFYSLKRVKGKVLKFGNFEALASLPANKIISKKYIWLFVKIFIVLLLVFTLSGIRLVYQSKLVALSVVLAVDVSSSMSIDDYSPSRLDAAKQGTLKFLDEFPAALNVGLISFSGESFVGSKLTQDRSFLEAQVEALNLSNIGGTNIGGAIVNGVNLLLKEEDKSKQIILLTDGQSTVGTSVEKGIEYANENAVSVNTIGIGTKEGGKLERTNAVLKLDEDTLKKISEETGGKYYRVSNEQELEAIYEQLASAGTGKVSIELSKYCLILALLLLVVLWGIGVLWYRPVP